MQLVVTEKPSVAQAISHVIGAKERKDGYMEGNGFLVSWLLNVSTMDQWKAFGEF